VAVSSLSSGQASAERWGRALLDSGLPVASGCNSEQLPTEGTGMKLTFIRRVTDNGGSPTLWATDRTDRATYIVRGWIITDPETLASLGQVPAGELDIEIPAELIKPEDNRDGDAQS
jgi:hypothetical protein